jgi:diguanylate cyclase (GGDEF)-like protein
LAQAASAGATSTRRPTSAVARGAFGQPTARIGDLRHRAAVSRAVSGIPFLFRAALLFLVFLAAMLAVIALRERRRSAQVAKIAQLDYLTGLANREGFDRQLSHEWQRATRYGRGLGIMYIDLDEFKRFNDTNGHLAGDRLLREISAVISNTARGSDFTARLGGDEFAILCPETTPEGLEQLARRIEAEARPLGVRLSIGHAHQQAEDLAPEDLVERADASMYAVKGGRRRVSVAANPMLGSLRRRS